MLSKLHLSPTSIYNSVHNFQHYVLTIVPIHVLKADSISITPYFIDCFRESTLKYGISPSFPITVINNPCQFLLPAQRRMTDLYPIQNIMPNPLRGVTFKEQMLQRFTSTTETTICIVKQ